MKVHRCINIGLFSEYDDISKEMLQKFKIKCVWHHVIVFAALHPDLNGALFSWFFKKQEKKREWKADKVPKKINNNQ